MQATPFSITCEFCGREASAIFACPERSRRRCPFVESWREHKWSAAIGPLIAGVVMSFLLLAAWPFWLGLFLGGVLVMLVVQVQLHNVASAVVLERTTLAGIQVGLSALAKSGPLPVPVDALGTVNHPLSVLSFASQTQNRSIKDRDRAACILRAGLLDLLLKGRLRLHAVRGMILSEGRPRQAYTSSYLFALPDPGRVDETGLGDIEKRLLRAAASSWPDSSPRHAWLGGRNAYNLVRQFYGIDREDPDDWVLGEAGVDSCRRGLSDSHPPVKRPAGAASNVVNEMHASERQSEFRSADEAARRFAAMYPDLWQAMYTFCSTAIGSRQHFEDDGM